MILYDVTTKVLDTESFPQHNIAGLISGITFIVLFNQEKPLRWKEINTHTHTHTHQQHLDGLDSFYSPASYTMKEGPYFICVMAMHLP